MRFKPLAMYRKFPAFFTMLFLFMAMISCKQNTTADTGNLPVTLDDSSRAIIDRAIAYAGGYEAWQQKKTVSFDKKSISYDSTGKVVRETNMHLDYMMKPEFRAKLTYKLNDTAIMLMHDGQKARKFYNGQMSDEQKDIDAAWNSSFGSQFVMCMPFKLKDRGIKAEYAGQVTLSDGTPAQVVKTSYTKGAGSNPDHVWYYYFEPGTGKLLANSLYSKNYWDFTRYETFEKSGGLILPSIRKGFAADTLNKPTRLVSVSTQYNIAFDKGLPEDYFKMPDGK